MKIIQKEKNSMTPAKILNSVVEPFSSVEYYKRASNKSILKSVLLFILVITLLGFIQASQFVAQNTQSSLTILEKVQTDFVQNYPEDLKFTWKDNTLSYQFESVTENPDFFSVPFSTYLPIPRSSLPENFAYITNLETTPEKQNTSTQAYIFFITPTKIFVAETVSSNTWAEYALSTVFENVTSFTLDKQIVATVAANILAGIQENTPLLQFFVVTLLTVVFFLGKVWFLCVETLLMFLFLKLSSITLTVKQTISLSIHILLTTAALATFAELIYQNVTFPLHTLSFWVVLFYISSQWKKNPKI